MSLPQELFTSHLNVTCIWTVHEFRRKGHLVLKEEVLRRKNLFTTFGLTAYAGAWQLNASGYTSPQYLVIEGTFATITTPVLAGVTSVTYSQQVDIPGDTQLNLGIGSGNQETVTFSAKSGTAPCTYTVSTTAKPHGSGDTAVRTPLASDSTSQLQAEIQYDSTNAPNQRLTSVGGYSPVGAAWTMQFFVTGNQATNTTFPNVGLSDSVNIGQGNLHNHVTLGYFHPLGTDVEIDATLSLTNN